MSLDAPDNMSVGTTKSKKSTGSKGRKIIVKRVSKGRKGGRGTTGKKSTPATKSFDDIANTAMEMESSATAESGGGKRSVENEQVVPMSLPALVLPASPTQVVPLFEWQRRWEEIDKRDFPANTVKSAVVASLTQNASNVEIFDAITRFAMSNVGTWPPVYQKYTVGHEWRPDVLLSLEGTRGKILHELVDEMYKAEKDGLVDGDNLDDRVMLAILLLHKAKQGTLQKFAVMFVMPAFIIAMSIAIFTISEDTPGALGPRTASWYVFCLVLGWVLTLFSYHACIGGGASALCSSKRVNEGFIYMKRPSRTEIASAQSRDSITIQFRSYRWDSLGDACLSG